MAAEYRDGDFQHTWGLLALFASMAAGTALTGGMTAQL